MTTNQPRVLIGITTLNAPDLLTRCLDSIRACTDLSDVQVLVADDGSNPDQLKLNKDAVTRFGCEMLVGEGRSGIAVNWNRLARHTNAPIVVLLNDDVEVVPDWLDVLVYSVEQNPHAGTVGLNCYTGVTKAQALPALRVNHHEATLSDGGGSMLASPGYAFAFRRAVFDEVGGFDERYFCFYEELDFGVALRMKGYTNFIASYPMIYHLGGATTSQALNMDAQAHLLASRRKFFEKWGKTPASLRVELESVPKKKAPLKWWNSQIKAWRE